MSKIRWTAAIAVLLSIIAVGLGILSGIEISAVTIAIVAVVWALLAQLDL